MNGRKADLLARPGALPCHLGLCEDLRGARWQELEGWGAGSPKEKTLRVVDGLEARQDLCGVPAIQFGGQARDALATRLGEGWDGPSERGCVSAPRESWKGGEEGLGCDLVRGGANGRQEGLQGERTVAFGKGSQSGEDDLGGQVASRGVMDDGEECRLRAGGPDTAEGIEERDEQGVVVIREDTLGLLLEGGNGGVLEARDLEEDGDTRALVLPSDRGADPLELRGKVVPFLDRRLHRKTATIQTVSLALEGVVSAAREERNAEESDKQVSNVPIHDGNRTIRAGIWKRCKRAREAVLNAPQVRVKFRSRTSPAPGDVITVPFEELPSIYPSFASSADSS